jgi:hypothetical protein
VGDGVAVGAAVLVAVGLGVREGAAEGAIVRVFVVTGVTVNGAAGDVSIPRTSVARAVEPVVAFGPPGVACAQADNSEPNRRIAADKTDTRAYLNGIMHVCITWARIAESEGSVKRKGFVLPHKRQLWQQLP